MRSKCLMTVCNVSRPGAGKDQSLPARSRSARRWVPSARLADGSDRPLRRIDDPDQPRRLMRDRKIRHRDDIRLRCCAGRPDKPCLSSGRASAGRRQPVARSPRPHCESGFRSGAGWAAAAATQPQCCSRSTATSGNRTPRRSWPPWADESVRTCRSSCIGRPARVAGHRRADHAARGLGTLSRSSYAPMATRSRRSWSTRRSTFR